jgi:hypothetical protein
VESFNNRTFLALRFSRAQIGGRGGFSVIELTTVSSLKALALRLVILPSQLLTLRGDILQYGLFFNLLLRDRLALRA